MYLTGQLIIGANDVAATAGTMKALNPATQEWIEPDFALGDAAHVHQAAVLADEAFDSYSHTSLSNGRRFCIASPITWKVCVQNWHHAPHSKRACPRCSSKVK